MIQDREGLQRDAGRLVEALLRTDSARHVQSITIKGALRLNKKITMYSPLRCMYNPSIYPGHRFKRSGLDEILEDEEPVDAGGDFVVYDEGVIQDSSEEDMAWVPFVNLLGATTGLKDLVYDCRSQLPPSLLRALHEQLPSCRLHHLTFRFRTLLWGVPYHYEMELATSPCLYRVKVVCTDKDSDGDFDYNMDAVRELAAGLAPSLKEVSINKLWPYRHSVGKPLWQGLPGFSGEMIGSLTSLSLYGSGSIQKWAKNTDFDKLQQLVIGFRLSGEEME